MRKMQNKLHKIASETQNKLQQLKEIVESPSHHLSTTVDKLNEIARTLARHSAANVKYHAERRGCMLNTFVIFTRDSRMLHAS